jgi:protein-tyrosine phosphatase
LAAREYAPLGCDTAYRGGVSPIPLPNGRDLGGVLVEGGAIRSGFLLRSAAPIGEHAERELQRLGVSTVVDLRTDLEREQQPAVLPPSTRLVRADVLADATYAGAANLGKLAAAALGSSTVEEGIAQRDLREVMLESYRDFAVLESGRRATADVVRLLAQPDAGPILVHCTAGKDRTGWIVAVLLRMLGAREAAIDIDYLASGPAVLEMFEPFTSTLPRPEEAREVLAPVLGVATAYLAAAFEAADALSGSFEGYLRDGLGLDDTTIAAARARLTEPA